MALPARWYPLRDHRGQHELRHSKARFDVVEVGRRAGKTETAKRAGVLEAREQSGLRPGQTWFTKYCAPTRDQAKQIYWDDLKLLSEPWWARDPAEVELRIFLRGGAELWVCGLDRPQRIEGQPCDRMVVDELHDVKPLAWDRHLRPALDTDRPGMDLGRAWLMGIPRPGTQFAALVKLAQDPTEPDYRYHHWTSASILSPDAIAAARRTMDPRTFQVEYEAKRASYEGLAYYTWNPEQNYGEVEYDPELDLVFCFDFNVEPGVAAVLQEQFHGFGALERSTCVIGEVHIPRNSNTPAVCRKLIADWGHHQGRVMLYGDATGGARKTSATEGTDWDLVYRLMREAFGDRARDRVERSNPPVQSRVNSMNSRICNTDGESRFVANIRAAPNVAGDFEGVKLLKGGSGEIDKRAAEDAGLSHLSDAIGYYVHIAHPFGGERTVVY